jgi:zinc transport system ATP-binding protein
MPIYSNKTLKTLKQHSIINLKNIYVNYGNYNVLTNVNIEINKGDFIYIVGPNGSGKTTLIKLLTGSLKPTKGEVEINSTSLGYLPQRMNQSYLFPITVKEVIYSGMNKNSLLISKKDISLINKWLVKMNIENFDERSMGQLSGGEQQRVFLIRSLINKPDVLIMDEPTSALDPFFKKEFNKIIEDLNKKGVTIIYVTHDLNHSKNKKAKVISINQKFKTYDSIEEYVHDGGH